MRKALPGITLYYKACTKYSPVLLCTAKLAQGTSQYYFVLQGLHKALPSTTLYHEDFTHSKLLLIEAFTHNKLLYGEAFKHSKRLHTERFTQSAFLHMASVYTLRSFYTEKLLHTEKPLHTASFYFYTKSFTHRKLLQKKVFHGEAFLYTTTAGIAGRKPDGSWRQSKKKRDFEALFK